MALPRIYEVLWNARAKAHWGLWSYGLVERLSSWPRIETDCVAVTLLPISPQSLCNARGCCWQSLDVASVPWCFFPTNQGYEVMSESGMSSLFFFRGGQIYPLSPQYHNMRCTKGIQHVRVGISQKAQDISCLALSLYYLYYLLFSSISLFYTIYFPLLLSHICISTSLLHW